MNVISTKNFEVIRNTQFNSGLIRAIDVMGDFALVGMRDGTIFKVSHWNGVK